MTESQTTEPKIQYIAISPTPDGQWRWDVFYEDEANDRGGIEGTLAAALSCVIDATSESLTPNTHIPLPDKQ